MQDIQQFINSGILEMYAAGLTSSEENTEVENMAAMHSEIKRELDEINDALEMFSSAEKIKPSPFVKAQVMSTVDFVERITNGEKPYVPPALTEHSVIDDYTEWLNREDMQLPEDFKDVHAKVIAIYGDTLTSVVWINGLSITETHDSEIESFLVVEGTCHIIFDNVDHRLEKGDMLSVPLHTLHTVKIKPDVLCKFILQRKAA